jgi:hypothetical protein
MKQFFFPAAYTTLVAFVALVSVVATTSSCTRDTGPTTPTTGPSAVRIGIVMGKTPSSRAVGEAITGNETESPLVSGHILFYNSATGLIDKHVGLDEAGITPNETIDDLRENRVVVLDVDGNVDRCMVIFNDNDLITGSMTGRQIGDVRQLVVLTTAINNAAGSIDNVPLTGDGELDNVEGTNDQSEPYTREVVMSVAAVGTRVQVGRVSSGTYTPSGGDAVVITAFTVEGIFINYANTAMSLDGAFADTPEIDYRQDVSKYVFPPATGGGYDTGTAGEKLADVPTTKEAAGTPLAVSASSTAGRVWAYNLLPTTVPHIIVRLSGISYTVGEGEAQTLAGDKWLTVSSYHLDSDDTTVDKFLAGNVYTLNDLRFNFSHLTDLPETQDSDVRVYVTVTPWVNHDIHWEN